jgi:hypothetical protein
MYVCMYACAQSVGADEVVDVFEENLNAFSRRDLRVCVCVCVCVCMYVCIYVSMSCMPSYLQKDVLITQLL